jgi:hypothetical protein
LYYPCWFVDAPVIACDGAEADVGQKNVELTCEVRARPEVTALYWMIDSKTGVVITADDSMSEYWTTNMVSININTDQVISSVLLKVELHVTESVRIFLPGRHY